MRALDIGQRRTRLHGVQQSSASSVCGFGRALRSFVSTDDGIGASVWVMIAEVGVVQSAEGQALEPVSWRELYCGHRWGAGPFGRVAAPSSAARAFTRRSRSASGVLGPASNLGPARLSAGREDDPPGYDPRGYAGRRRRRPPRMGAPARPPRCLCTSPPTVDREGSVQHSFTTCATRSVFTRSDRHFWRCPGCHTMVRGGLASLQLAAFVASRPPPRSTGGP